MKRILLILIIIVSQKIFSQEYKPMLVDGKSWEMQRTVYLPQIEYTYFSYYIEGNISFNGISYFIIKNTEADSYTHYLREEIANKIVYEYYPNTDTERVLYDFNVSVGDSFNCTFEIDNYILCEDGLFTTLVTEIGSTEIYGMETTYYDVDFIDDTNTIIGNFSIIEGFGFSVEGLFSNRCPFCPTDLPDFSVYSMNTMRTEKTKLNRASVYFNRFNKQLILKNSNNPQKIVLYSVLGREVLSKKISKSIDVSQLNYGMYYYSLSSDIGIVKGKLLIQ